MASTKQRKAKAKKVAHHNRSRRNQADALEVHEETGIVYAARGTCPVCHKREKLRKDGTLTAHGVRRCAGAGQKPVD